VSASGATSNCNRDEGTFDCSSTQYTAIYKDHRHLSSFPLRAHFSDAKYKNKKPIPSNNSYVAVEGFLTEIDTDSTGQVSLFHIDADNIGFLGKAVIQPAQSLFSSQVFILTTYRLQSLLLLLLQLPLLSVTVSILLPSLLLRILRPSPLSLRLRRGNQRERVPLDMTCPKSFIVYF
jgi:hypothetical protein